MPDSSHHSRNEIYIGWDEHLDLTSAAMPIRCLLGNGMSMI